MNTPVAVTGICVYLGVLLQLPGCARAHTHTLAARVHDITCALTCASVCTRQCASVSPQPVAVPLPVRVCSAPCAQGKAGRGVLDAPRTFGKPPPGVTPGICLHHPSFLHPTSLLQAPAGNGRAEALQSPAAGCCQEPYEGRGTSYAFLALWNSSGCPDPGSQKSRSQQPWGRSYTTRLPAPCRPFPTSSEQLKPFMALHCNISF